MKTHLIFKQRSVHDSNFAVREFADITAKKDGLSGLDHLFTVMYEFQV